MTNPPERYIFKNVLSETDFQKVSQVVLGSEIDWYFNPWVVNQEEEKDSTDFQFVHTVWKEEQGAVSHAFPAFYPLFEKLNIQHLLRAKLNLSTQTPEHILRPFHTDLIDEVADLGWTAVYSFSDNNGCTVFEDDRAIPSRANCLVLFKSNIKHAGVTATNINRRVVLNINFLGKYLPENLEKF
tara:strand:- start:131 stop:682 length:552 start_codon:yes stop_codon:yes gene_type:complete